MKLGNAYLLILGILLWHVPCLGQSEVTGINTLQPDPSSLLHVESDTSGLLVPRLSSAEISSINSPATGLALHELGNGLKFYGGNKWVELFDQDKNGKIYLNYFDRFTPSLRFRSNPGIGFVLDLDGKMKWTDKQVGTRYYTMYKESRGFVAEVLTYVGNITFQSPSTMILHSTKSLFEYECEPNSQNYFYGLDSQGNMQTIEISQDGINNPSPILFAVKTRKQQFNIQEWRNSNNQPLLSVSPYGDFQFSSSSIVIDEMATQPRLGTATLNNGSITISNTSISTKDRIMLSNNKANGTVGDLYVSINPGTGFTIHSTNNLDQSEVAWFIVRSF